MKQLRAIRILLAVIFLAAAVACIAIGPHFNPIAAVAGKVQIALSALSITIGATFVWLLVSLLFGRVYCATVCPVGTLSDLFLRLRRRIPRLNRPFSYRPQSRASIHILWVYLICLLVGIGVIPLLIEPWNITRNIVGIFRPSVAQQAWIEVGLGAATGIVAGVVSLILIAALSLWRGREFCTSYCPIGYAMGKIGGNSLYRLEIDRDLCDSCGLCEDECRASCIKVVSRYIDNTRCVRCLDCAARCPRRAIRFQISRNRPATPLFRRKTRSEV